MEIRHLRYFCVLAEQLHFTKAALLLNTAQPALSQIERITQNSAAAGAVGLRVPGLAAPRSIAETAR